VREPIQRPIELAPAKVRELMGARRGVLLLPMRPVPVLTGEQRQALLSALQELGFGLLDDQEDLDLIAHGFDEGLLPSLRCPWGRGGDLLWVREPWAGVGCGYRHCSRDVVPAVDDVLWSPAVRMPREAARLVLKLDEVAIGRDANGAPAWAIGVEVLRG
jgi:hypothetical protein